MHACIYGMQTLTAGSFWLLYIATGPAIQTIAMMIQIAAMAAPRYGPILMAYDGCFFMALVSAGVLVFFSDIWRPEGKEQVVFPIMVKDQSQRYSMYIYASI